MQGLPTNTTANLLVAHNLVCRRGQSLLFADLSFSLAAGEMLFVQGENGSGKTTLLRSLCGLSSLVKGSITWRGKELEELTSQDWQDWLYLGHKDGLKEELSPLENLLFWQGLRGNKPDEAASIQALQRAGLRGKELLAVRYLSQGQRRRAALARLLLNAPLIWVLDEPLAALDVNSTQWLSDILAEHLAAGGLILATSHQPFASCLQPKTVQVDALSATSKTASYSGANFHVA